jgi:hypothetical protein
MGLSPRLAPVEKKAAAQLEQDPLSCHDLSTILIELQAGRAAGADPPRLREASERCVGEALAVKVALGAFPAGADTEAISKLLPEDG